MTDRRLLPASRPKWAANVPAAAGPAGDVLNRRWLGAGGVDLPIAHLGSVLGAAWTYCRPLQAALCGKVRPTWRSNAGTSMADTVSAATSLLSRPLVLVAALAGIVLAGTLALWAHYGTAVFYEMIVAGIAACL